MSIRQITNNFVLTGRLCVCVCACVCVCVCAYVQIRRQWSTHIFTNDK